MSSSESLELASLLAIHKGCQQIHEQDAPTDPQARLFEGYALSEILAPQSRAYKAAEILVAAEIGYLPSEEHQDIGFWINDFEAEGSFDLLSYVMDRGTGKLAWVLAAPEFKNQVTIDQDDMELYNETLGTDYDFTIPPNKQMPKPLYVPVDSIVEVRI